MLDRLISDPASLTPETITEALASAGLLRHASVLTASPEPVGTGQQGETVRFRLTYDRSEQAAPLSVIGKFTPTDPTSRATGTAVRAYETEVRFYREVASTVGVRAPRCYLAGCRDDSSEFSLLLEDIASGEPGDQLVGCTVDEADRAVGELVSLHAPRWGDPSLTGLSWLDRRSEPMIDMLAGLLAGTFAGFAERYGSQLSADELALCERFVAAVGPWLRYEGTPGTVTHGDFRVDNLLLTTDEVVVVDWQTAVVGPGLVDVSYFLGSSLPVDDRREHEADLVRSYHDQLCAAGVSGYTWAQCWQDYRRFAFGGVLMVLTASMLVGRTDRGDEMFTTWLRRHCQQIVDLEAEELLPAAAAPDQGRT